MRNYELTFIIDPVLSGDEIKATANKYIQQLKDAGCEIVYINEWGLRQLAYVINKRSTGVYYTIEFAAENGAIVDPIELELRRDEKILRFLTVKLDKFGVKYNEDKRAGKIGAYKRKRDAEYAAKREEEKKQKANQRGNHRNRGNRRR